MNIDDRLSSNLLFLPFLYAFETDTPRVLLTRREFSSMLAREMHGAWLMEMRQTHQKILARNFCRISCFFQCVYVAMFVWLGEKRVQTKLRPISDFFLWLCSFFLCGCYCYECAVYVCWLGASTSVIAHCGCCFRIFFFYFYFLVTH